MPGPTPIATLAKKTAETRRVLMSVFGTDLGHRVCLDLMGLANPTPEQLAFARTIAAVHRDTLANSQLFLADPDMVDLLDTAAPTMPDQELHETDIITPNGFVYFAEPLPDRSGVAPEIPIQAMSWAYIPPDSPLVVEREAGASILITAYVSVRDSLEMRGMLGPGREIAPGTPKYVANSTVMWTIGTLIGTVFGDAPPSEGYTPGFYQRVMAAFWTLAQQPKMTTTSQAAPGQPTDQRRNRRAGVIDPNAPVHVIRLHHAPTYDTSSPARSTPGDRHVKVRFVVRGFWRSQWYPSVQQHRHIWIDSHWRGPEDAPVVGGERIFLAHGPKVDAGKP